MTLAGKLTLLLAGVATVVTVATGLLGYAATSASLQAQLRQELQRDADDLAAGFVPAGVLARRPAATPGAVPGSGSASIPAGIRSDAATSGPAAGSPRPEDAATALPSSGSRTGTATTSGRGSDRTRYSGKVAASALAAQRAAVPYPGWADSGSFDSGFFDPDTTAPAHSATATGDPTGGRTEPAATDPGYGEAGHGSDDFGWPTRAPWPRMPNGAPFPQLPTSYPTRGQQGLHTNRPGWGSESRPPTRSATPTAEESTPGGDGDAGGAGGTGQPTREPSTVPTGQPTWATQDPTTVPTGHHHDSHDGAGATRTGAAQAGSGQGGSSRDGSGRRRPEQFLAQRLDRSGTPAAVSDNDPSGQQLPVDRIDRQLAGTDRSGVERFRTVTVGGNPYLMLTRSSGSGLPAVQVARSLTDKQEVLGRLAQRLIGIGLGVVLVAAGCGWLVARQVTRRLVRLTAIAERVGSTGRVEVPVPFGGRDEVARLASAMTAMLEDLATARDDQQRLVQNAGHELRTPLTSIRTNVSLLHRFAELSDRARQDLVRDLVGETRELSQLIDELVELATDGRSTEPEQPICLAVLVDRLAERARRRTGRQVVVDADGSVVLGRVGALERAVSNLLDNAAKFDREGREPIEVRVREGAVEVLDRGPGVPEAERERVFDRFHRATTARSLPGSGLGLSIVKDVAAAHGGTVFAANRPGGGARIGFRVGSRALLQTGTAAEPAHAAAS